MRFARVIFASLCIAVAVLVAVLWVYDRTKGDVVALFEGESGRLQAIGASSGRIYLLFSTIPCGEEHAWTCIHLRDDFQKLAELADSNLLDFYPRPPPPTATSPDIPGFFGFAAVTSAAGVSSMLPTSKLVCVVIPDWFAILLPLTCGSWMLFGRAAQRHRRRARGLCAECGYDLRASSGRCPECGTVA